MKAKVGLITAVVVVGVVLILILVSVLWTIGSYNSLIQKEETIDNKWAQVENEYQRKIDLIPSIVSVVDDYKEFEESTLINITSLRTEWMNTDDTEDQVDISNQLDTALRSIILVYENYPYLQSIQAVRDLIVDLEGAENRITTERMRYNDAVRDYNTKIKQFPTVLIASTFGFEERSYFESDIAPENP